MRWVLRFFSSTISALAMAIVALVLISTGFAIAEQLKSTYPSICGTVVYQPGVNPPVPIGCQAKSVLSCNIHPRMCSTIYYDPRIGYYCACSNT